MRIIEIISEDKEAFVKALKGDTSYALRGAPIKFDRIYAYNSDAAEKILGRQLSKVQEVAKALGIVWRQLYATQFDQSPAYNAYHTGTRPVWKYILVGKDKVGNEIAYYKYEGGTGGGGRSNVYANGANETKLSYLLYATPIQGRKALGIDPKTNVTIAKKAAAKAKIKKRPMPDTEEKIMAILKRKFPRKRIFLDDGGDVRMLVRKSRKSASMHASAYSFYFFHVRGGKIRVGYEFIVGNEDIKRGYSEFASQHRVGTYDTVGAMLNGIREYI